MAMGKQDIPIICVYPFYFSDKPMCISILWHWVPSDNRTWPWENPMDYGGDFYAKGKSSTMESSSQPCLITQGYSLFSGPSHMIGSETYPKVSEVLSVQVETKGFQPRQVHSRSSLSQFILIVPRFLFPFVLYLIKYPQKLSQLNHVESPVVLLESLCRENHDSSKSTLG